MKEMFRMIVLVFALTIGANCLAQQKNDTKLVQRVAKEVAEMAEVMNLTDDQKTKLTEARKEYHAAKDLARSEAGTDNAMLKVKMKEINKKYNEIFESACSKEQRENWNQYRKASKEGNK